MRKVLRHLLVASAVFYAQAAVAASGVCDGIMPARMPIPATKRPITAEDLLRLRDIGYSYLAPGQKLLALSPDQRLVAFTMFRGDRARNAYCEAVFVLDRTSGQARKVAESTELILDAYPIRGVRVDYGFPKPIVPLWSPDGRWLAYLKRQDGRTQIWRVSVDGSREERMSSAPVDVDRFSWTKDGSAIVYETQPGLVDAEQAIEREGLRGYLFDDRIAPYSGSRPLIRLPLQIRTWRLDLANGQTAEASQQDAAELPLADPFDPTQNMRHAISASGRRLWAERRDPDAHLSPIDLWGEDQHGRKFRCPDSACISTPYVGIQQLWWTADGRQALFLRREGWGNSKTALYAWTPGAAKARRMLSTDDLLLGCELADNRLICTREGSSQPRRLTEIDLRNGVEHTLFNPNPEFDEIQLGSVERVRWTSGDDVETFGDLVLPSGYRHGQRLPLVIVQYLSTGFLRGGVGDEYPIQLFAAHGYAVLSFQAPSASPRWDGTKKNFEETIAATSRNWVARRAKFAALEAGIRLLVDRGIVDPARIGISGPSDGAATVQFGLINRPTLFAAASISSCCEEPTAFMLYGGIGLADERATWGFPPARGPGSEDWGPVSIAINAATVKTPLLMQLADHEYLTGVDAFMSLRAAHKPVEMSIFPGEFHLKWQPAHREAAYRRNLQWFDFWLRGQEDPDPVDPDQYRRWRDMRTAQVR